MKHPTLRKTALLFGCVTVGALLLPGGQAVAASITQVFITNDNAHSVPVHSVGTSTVAGTVNIGNLPATQPVSGTVNTIGALPANPVTVLTAVGSGTTPIVENAAGLAITSLTFSNPSSTDAAVLNIQRQFPCSNQDPSDLISFVAIRVLTVVTVPPSSTVFLPYPSPLVVVAGDCGNYHPGPVSLVAQPINGTPVDLTLMGYRP